MRCPSFALLLCSLSALADIRVAQLITDGMVVQRDMPVHIWGFGTPGESVTVEFLGSKRSDLTDRAGRWSVWFPPVSSPGGPHTVMIHGAGRTIAIRDVLVGDVWVAAGQSNMEWPVAWAANPAGERAAARFDGIRLVRTMHRVREYPTDDFVGTRWQPCTPESVENFSAVGYHFARLIHTSQKVPIGIIQTAWGGTPAEAWTSLHGLASDATLMPVFAEWARISEAHETTKRVFRYELDNWARAASSAKKAGKGEPERPELRTGPGGPWTPSGLFNGMVAPLTELPIKGVIWYQGESNTAPERAPMYGRLFPALIASWRRAWRQGDFPFLFVQLANYRAKPESLWPEIRDAQRSTLSVANTAMAVAIDAGEPGDIHPRNKRVVAERLSLAARALVYGENLEYSGPSFRNTTVEGERMRLWFDHAAGLTLRQNAGFTISGETGPFHAATAVVEGTTVVVSAPEVPHPRHVRYAWSDNPEATLFNGSGLPASPFRTGR